MSTPTTEDWGKIHAKAWREPAFRDLLESDPRKALDLYGQENGKSFDKIMDIGDKPSDVHEDDLHKHDDALAPPACC